MPILTTSPARFTRRSGQANALNDPFDTPGPLPALWRASTWTVSAGGRAANAPTLGAELLVDGPFESATLTNWSAAAQVTLNERSTEQIHGDTYARKLAISTASTGISQAPAAIQPGDWIRGDVWAYNTSGRAMFNVLTGSSLRATAPTLNTWQHLIKAARYASGSKSFTIVAQANNVAFYADDAGMKRIEPATLFATFRNPAPSFYLSAGISTIAVEPAGLVAGLDDPANPQNYILLYSDSYNFYLDKIVAGVATNLVTISSATHYVDQRFGIERQGDMWQLMYMNIPQGAPQTVANMGDHHGLFATTENTSFDNVHFRALTDQPRIGIVGDSISTVRDGNYYWTRLWERDYAAQIVSKAVSGANIVTHMGAQCTALAGQNLARVVVLLGINDTSTAGLEAAYLAGLQTLVAAYGAGNVIALGITPVSGATAQRRIDNNPLIASACAAAGVTYVDTDGWLDPATDTSDGVHPNAVGAPKLLAQVLTQVRA